ncbi:unnamed protein product [Closterium sp. NIES-65]|nr:unnamed protein product [Closterium sp. NIES-65]
MGPPILPSAMATYHAAGAFATASSVERGAAGAKSAAGAISAAYAAPVALPPVAPPIAQPVGSLRRGSLARPLLVTPCRGCSRVQRQPLWGRRAHVLPRSGRVLPRSARVASFSPCPAPFCPCWPVLPVLPRSARLCPTLAVLTRWCPTRAVISRSCPTRSVLPSLVLPVTPVRPVPYST